MKLGSLFSGVGGLELGLERAFGGSLETVWQVEKEPFCRKVLERHWAHAKRYDDVRTVGAHNLEPVDILCGGFPCQSISIAGKQEGLANEEKSGLWWQFHRIISELRPKVVVLENVSNVLRLGGTDVVGSLAQIGYDCEWTIVSARQFGAPHLRKRWFGVAYTNMPRCQKQYEPIMLDTSGGSRCGDSQDARIQSREHYWKRTSYPSPFCRVDDGISHRLDRLKSLGNAVVPQCAEWIGQQIINSNLLEVACSTKN